MFEHVLTPNIDDEGDLRFDCGDVGEILLRSDTDVGASLSHQLQRWNDSLIGNLIREEVLISKRPALFGELRNHSPELVIFDGRLVLSVDEPKRSHQDKKS